MSIHNTIGSQSGQWTHYHSHGMPAGAQPSHSVDAPGMQIRSMGLKVNYTFDQDQQNCLARWPHTLQIRAISIDDMNVVGIVDLRICLQAIAQCSPEIVNSLDKDYAVYALDYSEDDTPLVGQGMLSWIFEQPAANPEQKVVTGRVTNNKSTIFGNGGREILEVRMKLNAVPKMLRPPTSHNPEGQRGHGSNAPTPTPTDATSEWSSFLQSNPAFGGPVTGPSMPSPGLTPARFGSPVQIPSPAADPRLDYLAPQPLAATPLLPLGATGSQPPPPMSSFAPTTSSQGLAPNAMSPVPIPTDVAPVKHSMKRKRSSSIAPGKKTTGNPRGRPPKQPRQDSAENTPEEVTGGDEPVNPTNPKKRAKTTKADLPKGVSLNATSGSLRVAASTSGSLRSMRPAASGSSATGGNHLQEVPRAPTPVPGQAYPRLLGRPSILQPLSRRPSVMELEGPARFQLSSHGIPGPPSQDVCSPSESLGPSPQPAYTPDESPAYIGSSPPMPRSTHSMRLSPPPSSPVLPPTPVPQPDSGFMSRDLDHAVVDCEDFPLAISTRPISEQPSVAEPPRPTVLGQPRLPSAAPKSKTKSKPKSRSKSKSKPKSKPRPKPKSTLMVIEQVCPGPPELLPKTSIYNPKAPRSLSTNSQAAGANAVSPQLEKAVIKSNVQRQELPLETTGPSLTPRPSPAPEVSAVDVSLLESDIDSRIGPISRPSHLPPPAQGLDEDPEKFSMPLLSKAVDDGGPLVVDRRNIRPDLSSISEVQHLNLSDQAETGAVASSSSLAPVAVSDPAVIESSNLLDVSFDEEDLGEEEPRSKNMSRKQSIKAKLEKAVESGQMPTFCSNCGAIRTPTWRKIFTQHCEGSPEFPVFSDKPGCITAIIITERDENEKPTRYQVIKKALGSGESRAGWSEDILCNSCGIWLSKFKAHRPEDRWEKDPTQIGKPRKKGGLKSRSKKAKGQENAPGNLDSEAYFTTDPIGPADQGSSPPEAVDEFMLVRGPTTEPPSRERGSKSQLEAEADSFAACQDGQDSTHSRGSAVARNPTARKEDDLGRTRRLLFPSPSKDGQPKALGQVAINVLRTVPGIDGPKNAFDKENLDPHMAKDFLVTPRSHGANARGIDEDDMADLFGTPPGPYPPSAKERSKGVFGTPKRPTPSHRPLTRSISRSIESSRSMAKSPGHALLGLQKTPTKTPRSACARRRNHVINHPDQAVCVQFPPGNDDELGHMLSMHADTEFDLPFSSTLNQLLSEANDFMAGSPAHILGDLDLMNLPALDSDVVLSAHLEELDFGHFVTDTVMPSSPPPISRDGDTGQQDASFGIEPPNFDGESPGVWRDVGQAKKQGVDDEEQRL